MSSPSPDAAAGGASGDLGRALDRGLLLPALLCAAVVVVFYGGLLVPGEALAARDIPFLHLPLRTALRTLVAGGSLPTWDPWEHGGQPLLSNPHYAAFYPLTWLLLWLPPIAAIHASVVLHAGLAFAGAWRLARRWELGRAAAALAAVGFSANGAFASLPGTLLMFTGFAWLPWAWLLAPGSPAAGASRSMLLGVVLALQILNGDPAAVLVTWLGLAALALAPASPAEPLQVRLRSLAGALALGLLLASVQVIPTWARLRDSARAAGLGEETTVWSTRPLRLLEAFNPRLFGDPARDEEDLYFGAPLNDKNYPFLQSIYSSALLASLGIGTLLSGVGIRRRRQDSEPVEADSNGERPGDAVPMRALALLALLGILLGLGRFDPLFPLLRRLLPFLEMLRYPEKFLLLTLTALVFAGAAGLDRLLRPSAHLAERTRRAALAVALVVLALDAVALAVAWAFGTSVRSWIASAALAPLPAPALAAGLAFVRREMLVALVFAAAAAGLLLAISRPFWRRALGLAAVVLVLCDLAYYGWRALPTVTVHDLTAPRELARQVLASPAAEQRVFSDALFAPHDATGGFRLGKPGTRQIETLLDALTPSSAATVGISYALHRDFDLMLTGWGRQALAQAQALGPSSPQLPGLLARWNVGTLVRARSAEDQVREFQRTRARPLPVELVAIPGVLPRWRFAESVELATDGAAAVARALDANFPGRHEVLLTGEPRSGDAPNLAVIDAGAAVVSVTDHGGAVTVHYRARSAALFVAAMTFDDGWSARAASGEMLPTWPTALGQVALLVPAAESGTLELRYAEPWTRVGGALSGVTALALLLAASRRRRAAAAPPVA